MVSQIIEVHRPAHTLFRVCTVGAGMRVGRGLHVGAVVAHRPERRLSTIQLGDAALGRGSIVGRPEDGMILGTSRLGDPSRLH